MKKILLLILLSLALVSCKHINNDPGTQFNYVYEIYIYDTANQKLSLTTNDNSTGNYSAFLTSNNNWIISVGVLNGQQVIFRKYYPLNTISSGSLLEVANVYNDYIFEGIEASQQKIISDSSGDNIYYCANGYKEYSNDIYSLSVNNRYLQNITNNTSTMVGSIVLSDDGKKLLYDEIDTSLNKSNIIVYDIGNKNKVKVRSSDTTIFMFPQFVHNSDNIICLERKSVGAMANIILISQRDTSYYNHIGTSVYVLVNNFPKISYNNIYPNQNEFINLDNGEKVAFATQQVNYGQFLVSPDGENVYIHQEYGGRELQIFNIKTKLVKTITLDKSTNLDDIRLLNISPDGSKVIMIGQRRNYTSDGMEN